MFGIESLELAWAYILCILASLLCVVYGVVKWNETGPPSGELRNESAKQRKKRKKT
ncbi:conserved hypothetical protein [Desulfarculus baarsii DSM 2075]|uniref:Uncharacterized protein n=1 Tax=Desulfarculus baarsii (strain ATCC 33931 / DSM 2075 / LMG 7858 / VKM B-1802 / 2st14) TaxID=644282 RepID=E1QL07_DESB2|nr:symporter small accessory protein [Desulfarculus baarsii]ADK85272.1 conserved hypothetical protein [Desulfarculus baarsii DSM 2075]